MSIMTYNTTILNVNNNNNPRYNSNVSDNFPLNEACLADNVTYHVSIDYDKGKNLFWLYVKLVF